MSAAIHEGIRAGWRLWQRRPRLADSKETLFAAGMAATVIYSTITPPERYFGK
jgi:hypothetical protein